MEGWKGGGVEEKAACIPSIPPTLHPSIQNGNLSYRERAPGFGVTGGIQETSRRRANEATQSASRYPKKRKGSRRTPVLFSAARHPSSGTRHLKPTC